MAESFYTCAQISPTVRNSNDTGIGGPAGGSKANARAREPAAGHLAAISFPKDACTASE